MAILNQLSSYSRYKDGYPLVLLGRQIVRSGNDDCSIGFTLSCQARALFLQHFTGLLTPSKLGTHGESWLVSNLHS